MEVRVGEGVSASETQLPSSCPADAETRKIISSENRAQWLLYMERIITSIIRFSAHSVTFFDSLLLQYYSSYTCPWHREYWSTVITLCDITVNHLFHRSSIVGQTKYLSPLRLLIIRSICPIDSHDKNFSFVRTVSRYTPRCQVNSDFSRVWKVR